MKVPPKRKGNWSPWVCGAVCLTPASMKVPPKRKGNPGRPDATGPHFPGLNESPSEKEGKSQAQETEPVAYVPPQ